MSIFKSCNSFAANQYIVLDTKKMITRAILAFLALPAIVAGMIPWLLSRIPAPGIFQSGYGGLVMLIGGAILLASVVSFYRRGKGTLAPWDPPRHLVAQDLYRFNRNPMYVGVVIIVLGWSVITGNPWNYGYALAVPVMLHLRVVHYEEKEMQRLFGREWELYKNSVPRWGFRLRPYSTDVKQSAVGDASKPRA